MNHEISRFRQQEQAHAENLHAQASQQLEFARVEDLLQYDSDQNPVPPEIAERVNETISGEPPPRRNWWHRIFGGSN